MFSRVTHICNNLLELIANPYSRVFNTWSACPDFWSDFSPDFWPVFLARVFFRTENTVYSTTGTEKYSFTVLPGQKNTVLQFYRDGEKREKNQLLKIPYIKNIALPLVFFYHTFPFVRWLSKVILIVSCWFPRPRTKRIRKTYPSKEP